MYERILVPLDGSTFAEAAIPAALSIAERAGGRICLLFVFPPSLNEYDRIQGDSRATREWVEDYLGSVALAIAAWTKAEVSILTRNGNVAREIVDEAAKSHDLIVMATHGRGMLSRYWMGSVADECIRISPRPVLLVRPDGSMRPTFAPALDVRQVVVPLDGSEFAESVIPDAAELARVLDAPIVLVRSVMYPVPLVTGDPSVTVSPDAAQLEQLLELERGLVEAVAEDLRSLGIRVSVSVVARSIRPTRSWTLRQAPA